MNRIASLALVLGLGILAGFLSGRLLTPRLPSAPSAPAVLPRIEPPAAPDPVLKAKIEQQEGEIARLRGRLAEMEAALKDRDAKLAAAGSGKPMIRLNGKPVDAGALPGGIFGTNALPLGLEKILPDLLAKAVNSTEAGKVYDDFIKGLNLPAETADKLRDLLAERARLKSGIVSVSSSGESMLPMEGNFLSQNTQKIRDLVGEPAMESLKEYERTVPARETVSDFDAELAKSNLSLTPTQREQLIGVFARSGAGDIRDNSFSITMNNGESAEQASSREVDRAMQKWDSVVEGARPVLNAQQNSELDKYLGRKLSQREEQAKKMADFSKNIHMSLLPALGAGASNSPVQVHTIMQSFDSGATVAPGGTP